MQLPVRLCSIAGVGALAAQSSLVFAEWQLDMTPGVTDISNQVFDLHRTMLWWCVAIGVVVFGVMFYSMLKHRKSAGHKAAQFHESTTVEIIWTILPFVILIIMAIRREFSILANRKSSAITDWLRALCRLIQKQCDDVPVGAIGMCFTGGFALTLMVDESVAAPVTCQPASLDGMLGRKARSSVGATEEDLASAFARAKKDDVQLLGMRFTHDITCPAARFDYLQQQLGENFTRIDIDSSLFNPHRISIKSHSVLTLDFVDQPNHPTRQAYDQMVEFLRQRLV